ncbi:MAG: Crp/Fnr family transcriptional regulator [Eubacteriales bacterium]|nr:Crp/Fnr family transcriptional regulator [Eubacteriales bacterium]
MRLDEHFPFYRALTPAQQALLCDRLIEQTIPKGALMRSTDTDSAGLVLIDRGQLRALLYSAEGRETTLYRLFGGDLCLFCAPCLIDTIAFDVTLQAEKDTVCRRIPAAVCRTLMAQSAAVASQINALLGSRLTTVVQQIEQVMWRGMDARVAALLLQEAQIEGTRSLPITHEIIAHHLGSHREVVTRTLRALQADGLVELSRGRVTLRDVARLRELTQ